MLASYAQELRELKEELQGALARLGIEESSVSEERNTDLHSYSIDVASVAATATATETQANPVRRQRSDRRQGPITAWNRRQLTQELASASDRRRQLEQQLEEEIQRDREQQQAHQQATEADEDQERRQRRRDHWQAAIVELQQQRADILRQIEAETAADAAAVLQTESREQEAADGEHPAEAQDEPTMLRESEMDHPSIPNNSMSASETQYSIGGVVTLEPLSSQQQAHVMRNSRSGVSFHPTVTAPPPPSALDSGFSRLQYWSTPDALNDVFSLQLKFAETMLKLEKSVQVRDQLLHYGGMSSLSRRNGSTRTERGNNRVRRLRSRHRGRSFDSGTNSDTSVMYRETYSGASFSSSAYSFSSLDSTPQRNQRGPARYQHFQASRATTAETAAPSSTSADLSPEHLRASTTAALVSFTPSSRLESPNSIGKSPENHSNEDHSPSSENPVEQPERTPTSTSDTTTPTTGSDEKSNTSSSKQVHFGDDAYSTPVIARKFNFDNPSIDEDDDEHEERGNETDSVLSFLGGGSSVTSTELNDASFLEAFKRFRGELEKTSRTTSLVELPLSRELFPAQDGAIKSSEAEEDATPVLEEVSGSFVAEEADPRNTGSAPTDDDEYESSSFPELAGLKVAELQERRRQLCLDIQAESAQLVLDFGSLQNTQSHNSEQTKNRLLALRDELKAVNARLSELE